MKPAACALLPLAILFSAPLHSQTRNVTFLVNSATVPDTVGPAYNMQIRGNIPPLTWGIDTGGQLTTIGGDYWSRTLAFAVGDTLAFKIFAGAGGWEQNVADPYGIGTDYRRYIVSDRDIALPLEFFNNGASGRPQYFRPWTAVPDTFINIYFRVNMQGANQVARFGYADSVNGDSVGVRGGGPGPDLNWAPTFYLTRELPASNGGFSYAAKWFKSARLRINKNAVNEGDGIDFKFLIGSDWGRDELQGQPNRSFTIPAGKRDTTIQYKYFDNIRPTNENVDTTDAVTYIADLSRALAHGGYTLGDTAVVRSGHGPAEREMELRRQGLSTTFVARDTLLLGVGQTLSYYYGYYHLGEFLPEVGPAPREVVVSSRPFVVRDTSTCMVCARQRPLFMNVRRLLRNVTVRWEVDVRPAFYQVAAGDTLFDMSGNSISITNPDSVMASGIWMNGPAIGGWQPWGDSLRISGARMWDDGTHGDQIAGDSIFTCVILASPDSVGIGTKGQVGQIFKFSIGGGDNECGGVGFRNIHYENIIDSVSMYVINSSWGSINPAFYWRWDYSGHRLWVSAKEPPGIPAAFELHQNYPNPFNPTTTIGYAIPTECLVTLKVCNILGQEVSTLVNARESPGKYVATFDAGKVSSGVYFYRLTAGEFVSSRKMIVLR